MINLNPFFISLHLIMNFQPRLYFAIPVMDEMDTLPHCLKCIELQSYKNIQVVVCVNQPERFRNQPQKYQVCENNDTTLHNLKDYKNILITVIDRASKGKGWEGKMHGVGWARKTIMDYIADVGCDEDIIVSMDADTVFHEKFAQSIVDSFKNNEKATALSLPYYHKLTGEETLDRSMLRYEIYMRYYAINMWRIHNPYCFTAIGSSMAVPIKVYKNIGGISPKLSGEDFYFLQKLRKYGSVIVWNEEPTFPETRYSDRVFFGTGPALIKGSNHDWESYPIYSYRLFDDVETTFKLFNQLFESDTITPMTDFLFATFSTGNLWQPLRENFKTLDRFRKSCCEKIDGLRILQYLKSRQQLSKNEANNLIDFLNIFHKEMVDEQQLILSDFTFENTSINALNEIRNLLTEIENNYRKQFRIINWY
ncbi:MAG: glycosyltransferase family 2 protein [Bacteroidota bacterium]